MQFRFSRFPCATKCCPGRSPKTRRPKNTWLSCLRSAALSIITGGGKWVEVSASRSDLSERSGLRGKEVLAVHAVRGNSAADQRQAAPAPHRGGIEERSRERHGCAQGGGSRRCASVFADLALSERVVGPLLQVTVVCSLLFPAPSGVVIVRKVPHCKVSISSLSSRSQVGSSPQAVYQPLGSFGNLLSPSACH